MIIREITEDYARERIGWTGSPDAFVAAFHTLALLQGWESNGSAWICLDSTPWPVDGGGVAFHRARLLHDARSDRWFCIEEGTK